jgi:hypothetical protein
MVQAKQPYILKQIVPNVILGILDSYGMKIGFIRYLCIFKIED